MKGRIIKQGVILTIALFLFACDGGNGPGPQPTPTPVSYSYSTFTGIRVESPVEVPVEALKALDEGVAIEISKLPASWSVTRDPRIGSVRFVAPEYWNSRGEPDIIVGGIETAGTIAGTLCGHNLAGESGTAYIKLPHQADIGWKKLDYLTNSVWYEREHLSEGLYGESIGDCSIFMSYTGVNDHHPHRP